MDGIGIAFLDRPGIREQMRLSAKAEALGYASVWVAESRLVRDAVSVLGALATATSRVQLGGLINTWTRGPELVATTLATLDELAPGRVAMALGPAWDPLIRNQGIERRDIDAQLREYLQALRRLLLDPPPDDVRRRPPRVKLLTLGASDEAIAAGAELADGVLLNGFMGPGTTRRSTERLRRPLELPQIVNVGMSDDPSEARATVRRVLAMYLAQQPHFGKLNGLDPDLLARLRDAVGGWPPRPGGVDQAARLVDDDLLDALAVAGSPGHCRERLQAWVDAGATAPVVVPLTEDVDRVCEALAPSHRR